MTDKITDEQNSKMPNCQSEGFTKWPIGIMNYRQNDWQTDKMTDFGKWLIYKMTNNKTGWQNDLITKNWVTKWLKKWQG